MLEDAQSFDESCMDRTKTGPPPIMEDLVEAARRSALARFYPFTSHAVLRFSTAPLPGGELPPVAIGLAGQPDEYVVWWGDVSTMRDAHVQLLTTDAEEAVTLAALLLSGWGDAESRDS
jgi:hypothetical protein